MGALIAIGSFGALAALAGVLFATAKKIDSAVDGRDPRTGVGIRWKARDKEKLLEWLRALADVARILDTEGAAAGFWQAGEAFGAIRGGRIEVVDEPWRTSAGIAAGELRGGTVHVALLGSGRISESALVHEWRHLASRAAKGSPGGHSEPEQALVARVNARLKAIGL
jgi:hypothetical protein